MDVGIKQYAPMGGVAQQDSEVSRQLNEARNALDRLMGRAELLRNALGPVLKPTAPECGNTQPTAPQSVLAPLSDDVRTIAEGIDGVVLQLESLLNRLAV